MILRLGLRPEDQRVVGLAFVTLLMLVASHAVLETARDALFLADLPARRLPWAYLGIAVLTFVAAPVMRPLIALGTPKRVLGAMLFVGAAGTAVFWRIVATPTPAALIALYIWTGLLASIVVTQFWVHLGHRMDVGQARRAYALVAAGGTLGATLGSLVATAVLAFRTPRMLLPVAASLFALAACLSLWAGAPAASPDPEPSAKPGEGEEPPGLRAIWADPYLKRLLPLAALAPIIAMVIDFLFKSVVTQGVPREQLGPFFARYNAAVNGIALLIQLLVAPRLLQGIGVVRSLCVLPGALGVVAGGLAVTGSLPAALVLRGTDGILRHSLHRAATEILFVPLSEATRVALRGLAESLGQRGGQVVGALLILVAMALGATPQGLAVAVATLCGLWLYGYLRLKPHYVDRFRAQLRTVSAANDATVPELDLQSLETLVATLSAPNDAEVLAAMDMLASFGRARLVPPLILYHPSPPVVLRALAMFDGLVRDDLQEIRGRLLQHHDPTLRAAALRALVAGGVDPAVVRRMLRSDASPVVRATALVIWADIQDSDADLDEAVNDLLALPDAASRLAVASTLGELSARVLTPVVRALLSNATPAIRQQVARALATDPDASQLPILTELLEAPESRTAARAGLLALGVPALEHLARVLADPDTPPALRRHLPRSISPFASPRAAEILILQLDRETDERMLYKILRGIGRMRTNDATLQVDRAVLLLHAERTLGRIIELLAYRVAHTALSSLPAPDDLLGSLLVEKEQRALEHVFRILQILETQEDFATMFAALSDTPESKANARELISNVLDGRLCDALLALTDSPPPAERLAAATLAIPVHSAELALTALDSSTAADAAETALASVASAMCADRSQTLSALACAELDTRERETPRVAS